MEQFKLNAAARLKSVVTAGERQDKQDVVRFCKLNGIHLNSDNNIPMIARNDGDLIEIFDKWSEAKAFLVKQKTLRQDGHKTPWL